MADEEQQEQRRQELLKLYFEFFKHFMTLSVPAAVVFLAIYKEGIADQRMVLLSLSAFGVAVVFAVPGRNLAINGAMPARSQDRQNLREAIDNPRLRTRPRLVRPFAVGSAWNGSLSAARNR